MFLPSLRLVTMSPARAALLCALLLPGADSTGEIDLSEQKFDLPTFRAVMRNPESLIQPCIPRFFAVRHNRDRSGRAHTIVVTPLDGAEDMLVDGVMATFERWVFPVPMDEDRLKAYLTDKHDNLFYTYPAPSCGPLEDFLRRWYGIDTEVLPRTPDATAAQSGN